jgi:Reverse transcriptase (RNA-dependent DNA polymerase)
VAKGFTQSKGVDYTEVFSPVIMLATLRLLMALVVLFDLYLEQMDVVTAFLYGLLDEVIFMRQPEGYVKRGREHLVCRLLKSLYGLKQSPRQWNKRFDEFMLSLGFTQSKHDCCLYMKRVNDGTFGFIMLALYVDDMLIAAKNKSDVTKLKAQLSSEFSMKDLGSAKRILGMEIHRDRQNGKLWLTQSMYTKKVLAKFNMGSAKSVSTPLASHFKLSAACCPTTAVEKGHM